MNNGSGEVLIIVGPAGSGKSTLASYISNKLGWEYLPEDEYWVRNQWTDGERTSEQEQEVQKQVCDYINKNVHNLGKSAVLEFILYSEPPNPLTVYTEFLTKSSIPYQIIALRPSVEEILRRLKSRGRPNDVSNLEARRKDAENQIRRLGSDYIKPEWIIDPTDLTIEELYEESLVRLKYL
jgi:adenylate kinase family enzyme